MGKKTRFNLGQNKTIGNALCRQHGQVSGAAIPVFSFPSHHTLEEVAVTLTFHGEARRHSATCTGSQRQSRP